MGRGQACAAATGRTQISAGRRRLNFAPEGKWISPRTGTAYPVQWWGPAGRDAKSRSDPLMEDQENDGAPVYPARSIGKVP